MSFGSVLQGLRTRTGLSQSRLADAVGYNHSAISRIESGGRNPSRDAAVRLADALGLDDAERAELFAAAGFVGCDGGQYGVRNAADPRGLRSIYVVAAAVVREYRERGVVTPAALNRLEDAVARLAPRDADDGKAAAA